VLRPFPAESKPSINIEASLNPITYLAGPYSKGTAEVRLARYHALTQAAARLIETQRIVYSPITMTHPIDLILADEGQTLGSPFWVEFDESFMAHCSAIAVLTLPGWEQSSGVEREVKSFEQRGVQPEFLSPEAMGVSRDNPLFRAAFDLVT
jgi:hypothetical protein